MIGDKDWALNQLRHARNSYLYTLAGMRLLNSDASRGLQDRVVQLRQDGLLFDPDPSDRVGRRFEFEFNQLVFDYTSRKSDFDASLWELYKFVRRNLITESFEVAKTYSTNASMLTEFRDQPWYQFARVARNAVAHNFIVHFDNFARAALPITWNGKTLDQSLEGSEVTSDLLDPLTTCELIAVMEEFVRTH